VGGVRASELGARAACASSCKAHPIVSVAARQSGRIMAGLPVPRLSGFKSPLVVDPGKVGWSRDLWLDAGSCNPCMSGE